MIHCADKELKSCINDMELFSFFRADSIKSLQESLEQILYPNMMVCYPYNNQLINFINDYPSRLGTCGENEYLLPLPLRKNADTANILNLHMRILSGKENNIFESIGLPIDYALFAIEDCSHMIASLAKRGIVRPDSNKFPRQNITIKGGGFHITSVEKSVIAQCCAQYPESFLLWKLATLRAYS